SFATVSLHLRLCEEESDGVRIQIRRVLLSTPLNDQRYLLRVRPDGRGGPGYRPAADAGRAAGDVVPADCNETICHLLHVSGEKDGDVSRLAGSGGSGQTPSVETKQCAVARHRQAACAQITDVPHGRPLSHTRCTGIHVDPEAPARRIDVELGDPAVSDGGGASESMGADEF